MIIATTNEIEGKKTVKTLGIVKGNTIRAKHIGKDCYDNSDNERNRR